MEKRDTETQPEEAERWRKEDRPREKERKTRGKNEDRRKTDCQTKMVRSMSELEELRSGEVKTGRAQGVIQSQRWTCKSWGPSQWFQVKVMAGRIMRGWVGGWSQAWQEEAR